MPGADRDDADALSADLLGQTEAEGVQRVEHSGDVVLPGHVRPHRDRAPAQGPDVTGDCLGLSLQARVVDREA
jgi:hypothetical protein